MANSITELSTNCALSYQGVTLRPIKLSLDTNDSDLTIITPASDEFAVIGGILICEATAFNLTVKSGSTTQVVLEFPANTQLIKMPGEGILFISNAKGEALKMAFSAVPTSALVYAGVCKQVQIR